MKLIADNFLVLGENLEGVVPFTIIFLILIVITISVVIKTFIVFLTKMFYKKTPIKEETNSENVNFSSPKKNNIGKKIFIIFIIFIVLHLLFKFVI